VALTAGTILIIKPGFFATEYKQCNRIWLLDKGTCRHVYKMDQDQYKATP
jgi:hypothetical protein